MDVPKVNLKRNTFTPVNFDPARSNKYSTILFTDHDSFQSIHPTTMRGAITMGLVVEHINKWFAQFQAIKDLSMEVKEGAIFGFLGANGAGKTTTMRMIPKTR